MMRRPLKMGMYFMLRKMKFSSGDGTMSMEFQGHGEASW